MKKTEPLVFVATSDISGITRGKAFPLSKLGSRLKKGVGWTPTNVMITCFDHIAPSPFGALGDLLLMPDLDTAVDLEFDDQAPVERFILGDITDLSGTTWDFCTRSLLKAALTRLENVGGVSLLGAFEHEFQFRGDVPPGPQGFSLNGFTQRRAFGETLMACLEQGGLETDTFMKEYGVNQYEVTNGPAKGVRVADDAVILREVTRMTAQYHSESVTFTPIRDPAGVGNGVHIHMSFIGKDGNPATWDANGPAGMSPVSASFVAGILKYLDSIIALTAPSAVSYLRLTPHRWSAAYNNLGYRDREASVRICPEEGLPAPAVTAEDLSELSADELATKGYVRLPQSLEEALERFEKNETVCGWFPQDFASVYTAHKQGELSVVADMDEAGRCAAYEAIY